MCEAHPVGGLEAGPPCPLRSFLVQSGGKIATVGQPAAIPVAIMFLKPLLANSQALKPDTQLNAAGQPLASQTFLCAHSHETESGSIYSTPNCCGLCIRVLLSVIIINSVPCICASRRAPGIRPASIMQIGHNRRSLELSIIIGACRGIIICTTARGIVTYGMTDLRDDSTRNASASDPSLAAPSDQTSYSDDIPGTSCSTMECVPAVAVSLLNR